MGSGRLTFCHVDRVDAQAGVTIDLQQVRRAVLREQHVHTKQMKTLPPPVAPRCVGEAGAHVGP